MDDSKRILGTVSSRVREKSGDQESLIAREVGRLVDDLLRELGMARSSRTKETLKQLGDLRKILSTNYGSREGRAQRKMPSDALIHRGSLPKALNIAAAILCDRFL